MTTFTVTGGGNVLWSEDIPGGRRGIRAPPGCERISDTWLAKFRRDQDPKPGEAHILARNHTNFTPDEKWKGYRPW